MKDTARAAAQLGVDTVIGFTGSSIWHTVAMFPPVPPSMIERGLRRTSPTAGTRSSTSSTRSASGSRTRCTPARSPTTTGPRSAPWRRSATGRRSGSTSTPATSSGRTSTRSASSGTSGTGSTTWTARSRCKQLNGRNGRLGSHLPWADPRRGWDFVSTGHGDVPWEPMLPDAQRDRLRRPDLASSGRTPAWTAPSAPPTRSRSSAG